MVHSDKIRIIFHFRIKKSTASKLTTQTNASITFKESYINTWSDQNDKLTDG